MLCSSITVGGLLVNQFGLCMAFVQWVLSVEKRNYFLNGVSPPGESTLFAEARFASV